MTIKLRVTETLDSTLVVQNVSGRRPASPEDLFTAGYVGRSQALSVANAAFIQLYNHETLPTVIIDALKAAVFAGLELEPDGDKHAKLLELLDEHRRRPLA